MAKWKAEELNTLKSLLSVDGIELVILSEKIPNRSKEAIYRKATTFNYGVKTGPDGISRLYFGKRTRTVHKKKIVGKTKTVRAVQEPTILESMDNSSDVIVAQNDTQNVLLHANTTAVNILTDNALPAEPDIVHVLAKFILSNNRD